MDEKQLRQMQDQHSRDEAQMRRTQQAAAGGARLVQPLPPHGEASALPQTAASAEALAAAYGEAAAAEQAAWARVKPPSDPMAFSGAEWDAWRAAVEARDRAARLLINHAMGGQP